MVAASVWYALAVVLAIILAYWYHTVFKKIHAIPRLSALPFIGDLLIFKSGRAEFYQQTLELIKGVKSNGSTKIWLGPVPVVQVHSANAVEVLLHSSRHMEKSNDYRLLYPWLGLGLLTSSGEKWKTRRHLLTPTFHFDILQEFLPVLNKHALILIDKLDPFVGGGHFDVFPFITLTTLDVICETAMGTHMDAQNDSESQYVRAVCRASELIAGRQRRPWLWIDFVYYRLPEGKEFKHSLNILHSFTDKVIQDRRAELVTEKQEDVIASGRRKRYAFLDMLLQSTVNGTSALSNGDIREEVDTFMFEGHDTTASGVTWSICLIGQHPDVQKKVHEEMDAIFGSSNREVQVEDLKKMNYLECAIKEAMRLYPPVPWYARTLTEDAQLGGYKVPKGTDVMVDVNILHRDERVYPEPEKYDPERFSPANCLQRHPFAYLPFSAGPRNCIGQKFAMMELKVVLAILLRRFTIECTQRTDELAPVSELILKPSKGVWIRLSVRS